MVLQTSRAWFEGHRSAAILLADYRTAGIQAHGHLGGDVPWPAEKDGMLRRSGGRGKGEEGSAFT